MIPWDPITPDDVRDLIDLTVPGQDTDSMARLQYEGIAALQRILTEQPAAYLADEVGMGKTYQAMGLAAVLWNDRPGARILFVSPRENLQQKWLSDYRRFFASNYRRPQGRGDDVVASVLFRRPVHRPVKFDRLRDWTRLLGSREPMAAFLRHTSFSRPVHLRPDDYPDLDAYWDAVTGYGTAAGLHDLESPDDVIDGHVTADNIGYAANIAFARAVNRRLVALGDPERPFYDLVVIDESQCLRNPGNQTNTILHALFEGRVDRWLFLSATPAHGSPRDIVSVLNHYPRAGALVDPELLDDLPAFQHDLERLMVRRSRRYLAATEEQLTKRDYRDHDDAAWAVHDADIDVLPTLAMGLLQKGLVDVLGDRGNRFKVGFLSSFESLRSSVRGQTPDAGNVGDWHQDAGGRTDDAEAVDDTLIDELVSDFEQRFHRPLPHPKLDVVAARIGQLAYGTDNRVGGEKVLVFTRRVSTVAALRDRLTAHHRRVVESRLARCWGRPTIDWEDPGPLDNIDDDPGDVDPEAVDVDDGVDDVIRRAMRDGQWLGKYRRTFATTGRNSLVFEDGWLLRLCRAGGVSPSDAAAAIPDRLWAEAWAHASRPSGKTQSRYQADRLRYLAWHALSRHPEAFGLDRETSSPWRHAYEAALHEHLPIATVPAALDPADVHREPALVAHGGLWTAWDDALASLGLALPGADVHCVNTETLLQRQVARTLLGQTLRLSDTLVDLWAADERGGNDPDALVAQFLGWLGSRDRCAERLRTDVCNWLTHLRTILDSSFDGAGHGWEELARRETWPQLYQLAPVLGVTGGSGAHQRATQQFRTPGLPRVIVCTDTLKEGVDLHLFCDRVVHYGVAWTAGDQEQRVGRVDRYFSQIERRIRAAAPGEAMLHVGYPHVVRTIERRQVERVMARQREAERLMDSPLGGHRRDSKELAIDAPVDRARTPDLDPFAPPTSDGPGRHIAIVTTEDAEAVAAHYADWHQALTQAARSAGGKVSPERDRPTETLTFAFGDHMHDVEWSFDGPLRRYVLTITQPRRDDGPGFTGGWRRRLRERRYVDEPFMSVLVPRPDDAADPGMPARTIAAIEGAPPEPDPNAKTAWGPALDGLAAAGVTWRDGYKASLTLPCEGDRHHVTNLYAYRGESRITATVADPGELSHHLGLRTDDENAMRRWARERTAELDLGYLDIHPRDGIVFGIHTLHGELSHAARADIVREVAWRADALEATITGDDRW